MSLVSWGVRLRGGRSGMLVSFAAAFALVLATCQKKPVEKIKESTWEPYISAYTSGLVSRETTVRVVLRNDAAPDSLVGRPLEGAPFSFSPAVKGEAVWLDRRTVEFRPAKPLADGQVYQARFELDRFAEVPPKLRVFNFEFGVIKQSIDVSLSPLEPLRNDDLKWQRLRGKLLTADVDDAQKVEQILTARQAARTLPVAWEHAQGRRIHAFVIDSIERGDDSSQIQVAWDGKPIGVDSRGKKDVYVPAVGKFSILDARPLKEGEQGISIRFSDPLRAGQNVSGLITLESDPSPRFTVEGNEIRVYFSKKLAGDIRLTVNPGIRNIAGKRFTETATLDVKLESLKPAVRFVGKGVILPDAANLIVPFEAVNLSAVDVRVVRVYQKNIPQFLQVNDLSGTSELRRVGRVAYKETVRLNPSAAMQNRWVRSGFDVSPLVKGEPGALYRIELRFKREYSLYPCSASDTAHFKGRTSHPRRGGAADEDEEEESEYSYWQYWDDYYYDYDWREWQQNRDNPCHPAYYRDTWEHTVSASRNFIASNIGLVAKKGADDTVLVAVTDLTTALPLSGVNVRVHNYQNKVIGKATSDNNGFAAVVAAGPGKPFLLMAETGTQRGYLRLDKGSSLPVSQFDVGGAAVRKGLKGVLYGERGVWRPGDSLFLTFVLEDEAGRLPANHPVTLELVDPRDQVVQTLTRAEPVGEFYDFRTATAPDAPTGNYTARVKVGGTTFEQKLKIETVMPNRLKIGLDFGTDTLVGGDISGTLSARWLTGATARNLKADVEMKVERAVTLFPKFSSYCFDDPARTFSTQTRMIYEGSIDAKGSAGVSAAVQCDEAPGMLKATFRTRVFEAGGAFSVDKLTVPFSPYERYVGILPPQGDRSRGMLLTDTTHTVHVVTVSPHGQPVPARRIQMKLYKVEWRWWWERGEETFADYLASRHHEQIACDTIATENGKGTWTFRVAYPQWGRFLIRALDLDGGHACGTTIYLDWPHWAGRAQKEIPGGASILAFSSDKEEYSVGERAAVTIPSGKGGRILVSLENGSGVLKRFWADGKDKETVVSIDITPDMAPTCYVSAEYLQPYAQTENDLPMRMYGAIPLAVVDPSTRLKPKIKAPDVLEPDSKATIAVSEENGNKMTYTLALVDEGLLDLTRFPTPDLWKHFYQREALGVMSWDLFDMVCGAYGAELERILGIGGDEGLGKAGEKRGNRFPPMVRFYGPFHLKRGDTGRHAVDIPQYVGSVRIMVVAGHQGAYGSAEKAVPVRKPLMILGTLPRVLGPGETVKLPISVFALEPSVKNVKVSVETSGPLDIKGESSKKITFKEIGDELVVFELAARDTWGWAAVEISAKGHGNKAAQKIEIEVRNPSMPVVDVLEKVLQAGEKWETEFELPGVAGTNSAFLELFRIPPIDFTRRLDYLIMYPHSCLEQRVSIAFPQLFLAKVVELSDKQKLDVQERVQAAILGLASFQSSDGGFSLWPGGGDPDAWTTSYAGHFMLEASRAGYTVPERNIRQWKNYQARAAQSWSGTHDWTELTQAYRLYTLALAGAPELGAMNRLREAVDVGVTARWRLAAAYALAGQPDAARQLTGNLPTALRPYREMGNTYGSDIRDKAMILETLVLLKEMEKAAGVAKDLARELSAPAWMSTQTTAYSLLAMAKFAGESGLSGKIDLAYSLNGAGETAAITSLPIMQQSLAIDPLSTKGRFACTNRSQAVSYVRLVMKGTPAVGEEKAASQGMEMKVRYLRKDGGEISIDKLEQGTDFVAEITIAPERGLGPYEQVALSQLVASGWEIRNTRFEEMSDTDEGRFDYRDIRDDRVYTYFSLPPHGSKRFRLVLHAAYLGRYYLPALSAEAMYDASVNVREPGQWVEVVEPGR